MNKMIIRSATNHIYIADFFSLDEFQCPCCHCVKLHPLLLQKLKGIRNRVGNPLIVSSGYRCASYNQQVGGVQNSYHLLGMAADIQVRDFSLPELFKISREFFFTGIGFYSGRNFLHLDIRPVNQPVYWEE